MILDGSKRTFPPFSLVRLLKTVFAPEGGERVAILIDLEDPREVKDCAFLKDPSLRVQRVAHEVFYEAFRKNELADLGLTGGELYAYKITGGSNLDLPEEAWDKEGKQVSFERDIYPQYDIILCVSTYSATAPLTADAKKYGFRGATLHGVNDIILSSGLSVDYHEVSRDAEKLRLGLTRAEYFEIDFEVRDRNCTLKLVCNRQEAQKSHGLCREKVPDIANLPAGEVYFVPEGAEGEFPMRYSDGTIGIMEVTGGRIVNAGFVEGNAETVEAHNAKLRRDPVTGEIGELGFGTQVLPVSGQDIQDEKILGTVHVATGRSDHLGGHLTPDLFAENLNATHDDILFAPFKTPEIDIPEVRMCRDGGTTVVQSNFRATDYLLNLLES
jgi:aminopeptidase